MRWLIVAAWLATGCAGTWGERGLVATYATSTALVACDAGQTIWASDGGRWDRMSPRGKPLMERNPVLGRTPDPDALVAIAVGNAIGGYIFLHSDAPRWIKWLWFGGVMVGEVTTVQENVRNVGLGACGVAGMNRAITTPAEARR